MPDDRRNGIVDDILCPKRSKSETSNASDETDNGNALVPCGIVKVKELGVSHFLEENLADNTKDVDGSDDD